MYPRNPLDVLAQQIAAMIAMNDWALEDIYAVIRGCASYRDLSQGAFEGVLDMMSGRYPADDFSDLRPTIVWDRVQDQLSARKGLQRLAVINGGTIAERGFIWCFCTMARKKAAKEWVSMKWCSSPRRRCLFTGCVFMADRRNHLRQSAG